MNKVYDMNDTSVFVLNSKNNDYWPRNQGFLLFKNMPPDRN